MHAYSYIHKYISCMHYTQSASDERVTLLNVPNSYTVCSNEAVYIIPGHSR